MIRKPPGNIGGGAGGEAGAVRNHEHGGGGGGGDDVAEAFERTMRRFRAACRAAPVPKAENPSHSKRSATLSSGMLKLRFAYITSRSPLPTISKGERQTRRIDALSSL